MDDVLLTTEKTTKKITTSLTLMRISRKLSRMKITFAAEEQEVGSWSLNYYYYY